MGNKLVAVMADIEHSEMAGGRGKQGTWKEPAPFISFFTDSVIHCV
jgi:hypothetical protein